MTSESTAISNLAIRQRIAALDDERKALMRARDGLDEASDAWDAADRTISDYDEKYDEEYKAALSFDASGFAELCVLTGHVLIDGDDVVSDDQDRKALMVAIPDWPPLETDDEDQTGLPAGTIDDIAEGVRPELAETTA